MRRVIVVVVAALALVALGASGAVLARSDDRPRWGDSGMAEGMAGRMAGVAGVRATDEAAWLREMVAHHQEAVSAAGELTRSEEPAMRAFGRRIVADQSAQVRLMEGWLGRWYPGEPSGSTYEPMMRDLTDLTGETLDRVFLQDMIGHHMAAVMMSQQLLVRGLDVHDEVTELARTIRNDQMREIRWMRARLGAGGWPGCAAGLR
jgi:uncharacterized protein (DUF305 family)